MRNPKTLIIPFRFPGYPEELIEQQTSNGNQLIQDMGIDITVTNPIVTDADADVMVEMFPPAKFDVITLLVPTWIEPPLVVRAAKPFFGKPMILWGYTTFQNKDWRVHVGGMAGSGAVHGSLRAMGIPHLFVLGMPDSIQIKERIRAFANLTRAQALLDRSKIGMVGYVFSGMHAAGVDPASLRMKIGPEIEHIDTYSLVRKMDGIADGSDILRKAEKTVTSHLANPKSLDEHELIRISKMYITLDQFCHEKSLDAITIKCHYELSQEFGQSACIPLSVLGNKMVASCESDMPVVITQLMMHYLSGGQPTSYADIHDLADNKALIGACGYAPSCMCINDRIVCNKPASDDQGLAATFSGWIVNSSPMKSGKVTLARLIKQEDNYTMHYVTGEALGDVGKVSELDCPPYPTTEIKLDVDMHQFAQNLGSHHYALIYKDLSSEIEAFCKLMNIKVFRD
jgi:L-fucose isomerase-like protein